MARVEVASDMKEEREIDVRGLGPLENFLTTHFKYQGNTFFGYKDSPFSR